MEYIPSVLINFKKCPNSVTLKYCNCIGGECDLLRSGITSSNTIDTTQHGHYMSNSILSGSSNTHIQLNCLKCGGMMPGIDWNLGIPPPRQCECQNKKKIDLIRAWECPRCGTINSPYTNKCDCHPIPSAKIF